MVTESIADNTKVLKILVVILLILLAVLAFKYFSMRSSWLTYGNHMQTRVMQYPLATTTTQALVIATTVQNYPTPTPLFKQPKPLEEYVTAMSTQMNRDIVVVDGSAIVLADTVPANVGKKYNGDTKNEVVSTISDGKTRTFVEQSADYPQGLPETVVPIKSATGHNTGAVILSTQTIH